MFASSSINLTDGPESRFRPLLPAIPVAILVLAALAIAFLNLPSRRPATLPPPGVRIALTPPVVEPTRLIDIAPDDARKVNAERPFAKGPLQPAAPFVFAGSEEARARANACLAAAAWYEAGDDAEGEQSVMQTVLNRVRHPAFPSTVCGVVFQGSERSTGCQFTFTCDGALARTPSTAAWDRARAIAATALAGRVYAPVGVATHYHTDWVLPYWSGSLDKIAKVRTHIFFRFPGYWGTPGALRRSSAGEELKVAQLARLSPAHVQDGVDPATLLATASGNVPTEPPVAAAPPTIQGPALTLTLRGSGTIRYAKLDGRSYVMQLDPGAFAGKYAMAALAICKGKLQCQVMGWRDGVAVPQSLPLPIADRASLSFLYVRDTPSALDRALWNCGQMRRANLEQCLPPDPAAIQTLIDSHSATL